MSEQLRWHRFADARPQRWRNGQGQTHVLIEDSDADGGAWTLRVSVADLAGLQPFSRFPGADRQLVVLGPEPITLLAAGKEHQLPAGSALRFAGEDEVLARAGETVTQVLNVITRRDRWTAEIADARRDSLSAPTAAAARIIVALADGASVNGRSLRRYDTVLASGTGPRPRYAGPAIEIVLRDARRLPPGTSQPLLAVG